MVAGGVVEAELGGVPAEGGAHVEAGDVVSGEEEVGHGLTCGAGGLVWDVEGVGIGSDGN